MTRERHAFSRVWLLALGCALLLIGPLTAAAAPPAQDTPRITFDESIEGYITESATEQEWRFGGHAGDVILIDMRASGGSTLDSLLTLLDPAGNTLMSDDDGGEGLNSRIGPYRLDQDGTYTIIAASYNGAGSYSLTLSNLNTTPQLTTGKPLVGTLDAEHPTDYFKLAPSTHTGQLLVRLEVTDDSPYTDPFLAVYGNTGTIAVTEADLPPALDPVALLPDESYVAVVSWNPDSTSSHYQIAMTASEVGLLEDGVSQYGEIDYNTYSRQHYFVAEIGDSIRVSISVHGAIAPSLAVQSADFSTVLFSNQGGFVREVSTVLDIPESGVYTVEITDGTLLGETGSYTLTLDWLGED